uniref:uncharacterized protein LOC120330102 n=1 Tax=Styela clava TaxID=7725 RepID=UPI001939C7CE|nr:uncharacterized protein LOC120330102 [Styela clava]
MVKVRYKPRFHEENKYYMINLALTNILYGILIITHCGFYLHHEKSISGLLNKTTAVCVLSKVLYVIEYQPFLSLTAMGLDIAYYCYYPLDYSIRMTKCKIGRNISICWLYTLILTVIVMSIVGTSNVCNISAIKAHSAVLMFPLLCHALPGIIVIIVFAYMQRMLSCNGQAIEMPIHTVPRFLKDFFLLFTVCTFLGILHVILHVGFYTFKWNIKRWSVELIVCLNNFFNCFFAPWVYCLARKEVRVRVIKSFRIFLSERFGLDLYKKWEAKNFFRKPSAKVSTIAKSKNCLVVECAQQQSIIKNQNFPEPINSVKENKEFSTIKTQLPVVAEKNCVVLVEGGTPSNFIRGGVSAVVPTGAAVTPDIVSTVTKTAIPRPMLRVSPVVVLQKPSIKRKTVNEDAILPHVPMR